MKKIIMPGMLIFILCALPAGASNVTFLVMETGLRQGSPSAQNHAVWENGLFDVFFETGHIVSNAHYLRIYEKPGDSLPYDAERDYIDAREGGMDYFVVAIINYTTQKGMEIPKPQNVSLRLFSTKSEQMLYEQTYTYTTTKNEREEYDSIRDAIRDFAANLIDDPVVIFRR